VLRSWRLGEKLKGVPIDILLNNAALVRTDPVNKPGGNTNQMIGSLDYKLLDDFIHTNVAGPHEGCRLIPALQDTNLESASLVDLNNPGSVDL
jgi:NAD(P)-dependent dehydrogenase (short-subunit alcohol dehydrogenase family)